MSQVIVSQSESSAGRQAHKGLCGGECCMELSTNIIQQHAGIRTCLLMLLAKPDMSHRWSCPIMSDDLISISNLCDEDLLTPIFTRFHPVHDVAAL